MELHDIFPPIAPVEYSLYRFSAIGLILLALSYILFKVWKRKKKDIKYYLQILEQYPKEDAKTTAYKLHYYGTKIIKTETQRKALEALVLKLAPYKYEREGTTLSLEIKEQLDYFFAKLRQENV